MTEEKEIEEPEGDAEEKGEAKKVSKGQKKKERAKKKKKGAEEGEPVNALAKIAAAKAAKHKEDEESRKKEEEDLKKQEELERIQLEIDTKRQKEEDDKRIKAAKEEYQRKKQQGLILTKAEQRQKEKLEMMRKELAPQLEIGAQNPEEKKATEVPEKKKSSVVYSKKNKKNKQKSAEQKEEKKGAPTEQKPGVEIKKEEKKAEEIAKNQSQQEDEDWEQMAGNDEKVIKAVAHKLSIDETQEMVQEVERRKSSHSETKKEEEIAAAKSKEQQAENLAKQPPIEETKETIPKYRSPILCVLGHVDTGKTKLLDKIRHTKVQESEVGGITQQIGATFFPKETLIEHAKAMKGELECEIKIPGLLIIDTPGHESFSNLRNRGSSLCDFAILVVDIMHGLENQTIESINILKKRKIPFVVALNKIDRCYGWKAKDYASSKASFDQNKSCHQQFNTLTGKVITQFAEQDINVCLYWMNAEPDIFSSLVPTSAITGEGIPDILTYITSHIQQRMEAKIMNSLNCVSTVMEVKVVEGYGITCDVILATGELRVNDIIVLSGLEGPIVTTIRALLTPQPLKEMRVKGEYIHHDRVRGSMGVKVCAPGLEEALAGSPILVAKSPDDVERLKKEVGEDLANMLKKFLSKTGAGVYVQSSTLGSLEALLELCKNNNIPVSAVGLGPIYKRHMLKVLKSCEKKAEKEEYATVLAFEVEPDKEAKDIAEEAGVKVFTAKIVYHLIDMYKKHAEDCLYLHD
jgi:translation initiation factor 5B